MKINKILLFGVMFLVGITPVLAVDSFFDLQPSHPNYSAIMDLKTRGIIGGYPDGTFQPERAVNRVEALKIILGAAAVDTKNISKTAPFTDISQTEWYAPYLNKAYELGIIQGYPDNSFKPTQTVNLVENLKMLLNTFQINLSAVVVTVNPFVDAEADQWYAKFVQYAKDKKLIEADAAKKVYPAQGMTRGKLAETVYRLIQVRENKLDYFGQVKEEVPPPADEQLPESTWDNTLNITISGLKFSVNNMMVPQGAKVKWINSDTVNHQIVSKVSGAFSSPVLKPGESWTYTFNNLGSFDYYCSLHPSMTGTLIVKLPHQVPTI